MSEHRDGGASRGSPFDRPAPWAIGASAVVLAVRLLLYVDANAVNLMVMDQFDFLVPLFDDGYSALEKFRFQFRESPHRMGAGWPIIEAVARASSWDTRADSFSIAGVLIVACALALWLVQRLFGRITLWDVCVPLVVLSLKQFGTLVGTPDVSLAAMPLVLLVGAALALTVERSGLRIGLLLALDLLCIYTGFALFAGLVIPVLLAHEVWARRVALPAGVAAIVVSGVFGLSFFIGYDATPATEPVAGDVSLFDYLGYATNLFVTSFHASSALAAGAVGLLWPVACVLPLGAALRRMALRDARPVDTVVVLLLGFGVFFVVVNTAGRIGVAPGYAFASRYVTLMIPGLLGIFLAARALQDGWLRNAVLGVLMAALLVGELVAGSQAREAATSSASALRGWKLCYLETHSMEDCNGRFGEIVYPHREEFGRIRARLDQLEAGGLNLFKDATP